MGPGQSSGAPWWAVGIGGRQAVDTGGCGAVRQAAQAGLAGRRSSTPNPHSVSTLSAAL